MAAITRRAMVLAPFALGALSAGAEPATFGRVTVDGWVMHRNRTGRTLAILLDGVDVTRRCIRADDRRGYVVLQQQDEHGHCYIGLKGRLAKEKLRGTVRIVERAADQADGGWARPTMRSV